MNEFLRRLAYTVLCCILASPCLAQQSETGRLLHTATSGTGQARYAAIDDLGEHPQDADMVVPQLRNLLSDDDAQVRWRSARALGDYGEQAGIAAADLRSLLSDKDPIVQYHAAVALGKIGDRSDETARALADAVTSNDARVARAAIAALRNLKPGPQRVAPALAAALKSNDDAVTLYALEALSEIGAKAVPLLNELLRQPETAYLAATAIEHIGPEAAPTVPALQEILRKTRHSHLLVQVLLALASIGHEAQSATPEIVPLLDHPTDATVPVAAAYALGAIGAEGADDSLRQALGRENNSFLQMVAAWSLAKLNPDNQQLLRQAVEKLTQGLGSEDPQLRTAAAKGLQILQPPPEMVAPALLEVANDPDPEVSSNAVLALAGLGEAVVPRAINALQKPEYRDFAVRVLTQLGPKASAAVDPLVDAMSDADPHFRIEAQLALAAIGPAAASATDALVRSIHSEDQGVRESALFALREIGPGARTAVQPLVARMQADDSFDAMAAAWALARIAPDDMAVAAKAVPKLTAGLSNDDESVRLESIDALAEWGQAARSAAVAPLQRVAREDGSPAIRAAAEAALDEIANE